VLRMLVTIVGAVSVLLASTVTAQAPPVKPPVLVVAVAVSVGASRASGGGRLAGNSGAGSWSGIITGDRCSGIWRATRS